MNVLILMDLQDGARPIRGTALSVPATHRACYIYIEYYLLFRVSYLTFLLTYYYIQ